MKKARLKIGAYEMVARLEEEKAPKTCRAFLELLPLRSRMIHVRWSGEGIWIPFGEQRFLLEYENHTSHPAPGEMLFYPGGISEAEIILAYGRCQFSSQMGQLAGNHFLTIETGLELLPKAGKAVLWDGAQPLEIELIE